MSLAALLTVSVMGESNTSSAPGQANVGGFFMARPFVEAALEDLAAAWPKARRLYLAARDAPSELDAIGELPFVSAVGLGPRVLRAETAALAALACPRALAGDWRGDGADPHEHDLRRR